MIPALLLLAAQATPAVPPEQEPLFPMTAYVARVLDGREVPEVPVADTGDDVVVVGSSVESELVVDMVSGLHGNPPPGIRKLAHNDEWGLPIFTQYEHVLVFDIEDDGEHFLSNVGFPVVRTDDGRWAYCVGEADSKIFGYTAELRGLGRPVRFASPVKFRNIDKERISRDGYSSMMAGARGCQRGIYAEELVAVFTRDYDSLRVVDRYPWK